MSFLSRAVPASPFNKTLLHITSLPLSKVPRAVQHQHTMASNTAAWIMAAKARPFEIKPAPLGNPGEGQILIKNHALAINPIDSKLQELAIYPLEYPTILGEDVAGEVQEVGPNVTRFNKGDRVIGLAAGFNTKRNEEKAFQAYTILEANLTSTIPDGISFERGVVMPLAVATAASGLFSNDLLNLQLPTVPSQKPTGRVLLVWGGASSVGLNAIQLAVAAGYEVLATASPRNFEYVKSMGASEVFDYQSPTVVADLVHAAKGKIVVGAFDAIGGPAWAPSMEFVQRAEGVKFVASALARFPSAPEGVTIKQMQSLSIKGNHIGKAIFEDFLPDAIKSGTFVPAPMPLVAGKGLDQLQDAIDIQRRGTSAQKVVVLL